MQRFKSLAAKFTTGVAFSLVTVQTVVAQKVDKPELNPPTSGGSLGEVLSDVIDALLLFAGAVAVLFLIIGGFRYVVSAGSPDQVEGAKKTILYAIVGLIIIFIAYVVVQLIQDYLGVNSRFDV